MLQMQYVYFHSNISYFSSWMPARQDRQFIWRRNTCTLCELPRSVSKYVCMFVCIYVCFPLLAEPILLELPVPIKICGMLVYLFFVNVRRNCICVKHLCSRICIAPHLNIYTMISRWHSRPILRLAALVWVQWFPTRVQIPLSGRLCWSR